MLRIAKGSVVMPGRGPIHSPSISSLKFSRTPSLLAVIFSGPPFVLNVVTNF